MKLFEFDGIKQHYSPQSFGSKKKTALELYQNIQFSDSKKADFCKTNNIPLLIIPYTETNIEEKIIKFLEKQGYQYAI